MPAGAEPYDMDNYAPVDPSGRKNQWRLYGYDGQAMELGNFGVANRAVTELPFGGGYAIINRDTHIVKVHDQYEEQHPLDIGPRGAIVCHVLQFLDKSKSKAVGGVLEGRLIGPKMVLLFVPKTNSIVMIPITAIESCDIPKYPQKCPTDLCEPRGFALAAWIKTNLKSGERLLRRVKNGEEFRVKRYSARAMKARINLADAKTPTPTTQAPKAGTIEAMLLEKIKKLEEQMKKQKPKPTKQKKKTPPAKKKPLRRVRRKKPAVDYTEAPISPLPFFENLYDAPLLSNEKKTAPQIQKPNTPSTAELQAKLDAKLEKRRMKRQRIKRLELGAASSVHVHPQQPTPYQQPYQQPQQQPQQQQFAAPYQQPQQQQFAAPEQQYMPNQYQPQYFQPSISSSANISFAPTPAQVPQEQMPYGAYNSNSTATVPQNMYDHLGGTGGMRNGFGYT